MTENSPTTSTWLPCHCCGKSFPDENLVHFHEHPEDALCLGCLDWLHNRSRTIARRLNPILKLPARRWTPTTRRRPRRDQSV